MAHASGPSVLGGQGRRMRVRGHSHLHRELEASLGYMTPCLKKSKQKIILSMYLQLKLHFQTSGSKKLIGINVFSLCLSNLTLDFCVTCD